MEPSTYRLTDQQKYFIVFRRQQGLSYDQIIIDFEEEFGRPVTEGAISKIMDKFNRTQSVQNFDSPGRPLIYSARDKRDLARVSITNQGQSLRDIANNELLNPAGASKSTIQRTLVDSGIKTIVEPKRLSFMESIDLKNRKSFAKGHLEWTLDDWKRVFFLDEADLLPTYQGKQYIRLRENQRPGDVCPNLGWKQKKLTIKVFGMVSYWGVGPLVPVKGTMDGPNYLRILQAHVEPVLPDLLRKVQGEVGRRAQLIMVDDNAQYHRVYDVENWKKRMGFYPISPSGWPSYSPDINIIENIWGVLEDRLYEHKQSLHKASEMWEYTQELWNHFDVEFIQTLYRSLPDRMNNLYNCRGDPINY